MSSQQVTLSSLVDEWRGVANTQVFAETQSELESFIARARENNIPLDEILRNKNRIVSIWCALTWKEAQEKHPWWKIKSKYDALLANVFSTFATLVKAYYPENYKKVSASAVPQKPMTPSVDIDAALKERPTFSSAEELQVWKAAGKPATNKEWQAWKAANPDKLPKMADLENVYSIDRKRTSNGV